MLPEKSVFKKRKKKTPIQFRQYLMWAEMDGFFNMGMGAL